ncbi:MAG: hypothetical protein ICV83_14385, partial [Cytophagales bacterium]|nr:hypothetical protein [Cytophagales bacterium]
MKSTYFRSAVLVVSGLALTVAIYAYKWLHTIQNNQTYYDNYQEAIANASRVETLILRNQSLQSLPGDIGRMDNL